MFSNFKAASTLFETSWTIYYQGCTENTPQHPLLRNVTAPSTAVVFPYLLSANLQVFCLFCLFFFGKFAFLLVPIGLWILNTSFRRKINVNLDPWLIWTLTLGSSSSSSRYSQFAGSLLFIIYLFRYFFIFILMDSFCFLVGTGTYVATYIEDRSRGRYVLLRTYCM